MSMSALGRAVRDEIRLHADFATKTGQVNCELDEQAPAASGGNLYVAVMSGGIEAGPVHDTSDGIIDEIYGIEILLALRSQRKPRDRQRDLWIDTSKSFETYERAIRTQVDKKVAVITAANVFIAAEESGTPVGFQTYLRWRRTTKSRPLPPSFHGGEPGEQAAYYGVTIEFGGAERCRRIGE